MNVNLLQLSDEYLLHFESDDLGLVVALLIAILVSLCIACPPCDSPVVSIYRTVQLMVLHSREEFENREGR